jgi:uncharacterized protein YjbI with pentapeptide repeats
MIELEQDARKIAQELSIPSNRGELINFFKNLFPFNEIDEVIRHRIAPFLNLNGRKFNGLDLERINLILFNLNGAEFIDCKLNGAMITSSNLDDTIFRRCQLVGAQIIKNKMYRTKFIRCNLTGADIRDSRLYKVELTGSNITNIQNLTQKQFNKVTKGAMTVKGLPSHIEVQSRAKKNPRPTKKYEKQSLWEKIFGKPWPPWGTQPA